MKTVRNIEGKKLVISYEGKDYEFPEEKAVLINDNLYKHLKGLIPLAFDFDYKAKKGEVLLKVKETETKVIFKKNVNVNQSDERGQEFLNPDETPQSGTTDGDGVGWYGEGLQEDKI